MEQGVTLDTSYKTPIKFEMAPEEKLRTSVVDKGPLLKKKRHNWKTHGKSYNRNKLQFLRKKTTTTINHLAIILADILNISMRLRITINGRAIHH